MLKLDLYLLLWTYKCSTIPQEWQPVRYLPVRKVDISRAFYFSLRLCVCVCHLWWTGGMSRVYSFLSPNVLWDNLQNFCDFFSISAFSVWAAMFVCEVTKVHKTVNNNSLCNGCVLTEAVGQSQSWASHIQTHTHSLSHTKRHTHTHTHPCGITSLSKVLVCRKRRCDPLCGLECLEMDFRSNPSVPSQATGDSRRCPRPCWAVSPFILHIQRL